MRPRERWLIWRLRQGDREAARELIRIHHHAVYGHLRRLCGDSALAEDLTQETYARAWSAVAGLGRLESLRAWLLTIARNQYLQHARRRRHTAPLDDVPEPADPSPGPRDLLAATHQSATLHLAVDGLDPVLRETVALHYFQELSLREVGSVLGVPTGTVKSRLNRGLEALRKVLEQRETNHERPDSGREAAGSV